jgi:YHS domain-containing protein
MFGETVFSIDGGTNLVVPQSAVLLTGNRNIVWIKIGENIFEPREVTLGIKTNNQYEIKSGLAVNDDVVVSGGYLIDSESQLKTGMQTGHNHNTSTSDNEVNEINSVEINTGKEMIDHSSHSTIEKKQQETREIFNAVCPILGGKVSPKVKPVEYKGKLIGFCCPGCDEDFLRNPELYMKNLSSDGKKFLGEIE